MRNVWRNRVVLAGVLALATFVTAVPAAPAPADSGTWIVHEWGTFLAVQGSDGGTLGGMVDSEEALPLFVRQRDLGGRSRASFMAKMETPVTYFYTDRPRDVQVRVEMPGGLLTHWFPDVQSFAPPPDKRKSAVKSTASALDWGTFHVQPDTRFLSAGQSALAATGLPHLLWVGSEDNWRFARETDSALVTTTAVGKRELHEKFLFYRGLGSFDLPLEVRSAGPDDRLHVLLHNRGVQPLQGLFAIWVHEGAIRFAALDDLSGGASRDLDTLTTLTAPLPLLEGAAHVKQEVALALGRAGLYAREAQAMVNTWDKSYFQTEGLRILAVLPRPAVDTTIPIQIKPAPEQLVRVMVGRIEVLTPECERRLEKAVGDLGSEDVDAAKRAGAELEKFGRLKEPVLRRVAALTKNAVVRTRVEALIVKGTPKK